MRFRYSTTAPEQTEFDSLPRVPLKLQIGSNSIESLGLVDSGAMVSILPYDHGQRLGLKWNDQHAILPLSGSLGETRGVPAFATGTIEGLPTIR